MSMGILEDEWRKYYIKEECVTFVNAAVKLSKMRAENWPLDSETERVLVTVTRAVSVE